MHGPLVSETDENSSNGGDDNGGLEWTFSVRGKLKAKPSWLAWPGGLLVGGTGVTWAVQATLEGLSIWLLVLMAIGAAFLLVGAIWWVVVRYTHPRRRPQANAIPVTPHETDRERATELKTPGPQQVSIGFIAPISTPPTTPKLSPPYREAVNRMSDIIELYYKPLSSAKDTALPFICGDWLKTLDGKPRTAKALRVLQTAHLNPYKQFKGRLAALGDAPTLTETQFESILLAFESALNDLIDLNRQLGEQTKLGKGESFAPFRERHTRFTEGFRLLWGQAIEFNKWAKKNLNRELCLHEPSWW